MAQQCEGYLIDYLYFRQVLSLTNDALSYVKERNDLWIKQEAKTDSSQKETCEFDRENLPYLGGE